MISVLYTAVRENYEKEPVMTKILTAAYTEFLLYKLFAQIFLSY